MRTFSKHVSAAGLILVVSCLVVTGCGPSKKQYAINEALLIDQTRLLENEVYKTRYQLQKVMDENARLKEDLGITEASGKNSLGFPAEKKRPVRNEAGQGTVPFDPPMVNPNSGVSDQRKILVIPQSQLAQESTGEELPRTVVESGKNPALRLMPVSKQSPAVTRLPGPGEATVSPEEPRRILVVPDNQETQSETLPQSIVQPIPKNGTSAGSKTGITPQSWDSGAVNPRIKPAHYNSVPTRSDNDLKWSPIE